MVDVSGHSGAGPFVGRWVESFEHAKRWEARVPDGGVLNGDNVGGWVTGFEAVEEGEKHRPAPEAVVLAYGERRERSGCDELRGPSCTVRVSTH